MKPKLSSSRIPEGQETRGVLRHGFQHWHDLYPARQRAVIEGLLAMSKTVSSEERALNALRMAIYGSG